MTAFLSVPFWALGASGVAACTQAPGAPAPSSAAAAAAAVSPSAVPAALRGCAVDVDCVAVPRVGCCHNGWKEAVATSQKDAYERSFTCPDPNPLCAMYLVMDARTPACDSTLRQCVLVAPADGGP